jgi:hypothetical protein
LTRDPFRRAADIPLEDLRPMREDHGRKVLFLSEFDMRRRVFRAAPVLAAMMLPTLATAQQTTSGEYSDGARGRVVLPQGDRSFADEVVAYAPGSGTIAPTARDPEQALGAPDSAATWRTEASSPWGATGR